MHHTILADKLIITADANERAELQELSSIDGYWRTSRCEVDVLEPLMANSDLQWIDPADTGDLTSAPLIGILGDEGVLSEMPAAHYGLIECGRDGDSVYYQPILQRWAFMDYQLRSFLTDLKEDGRVVFTS